MNDDVWPQIVEVHNETKTLFLLAEELEHEKFQDFIQPINEHRHALEHIIRAKANELGLNATNSQPSSEYQSKSLDKALGHEYRAFFDCADWIAIILREEIRNTLRSYDPSCIQTALPDYYSSWKPRILEISADIAKIRGEKDISKEINILAEVRKYKSILSELHDIHEQIIRAIPSLEEYRSRTHRKNMKQWCCTFISGVISGVIGGLLVAFVCWCSYLLWKTFVK